MVKCAYCNNTMLKRFVEMYRLVHIYMYVHVYVHVYFVHLLYSELGSAYVHLLLRLPCLRCLAVNYVGSNWGCMGVWRVNTVTSTSQLRQPSTMWGRTGGVWVCGGLTPSLQHHNCVNRQLCGVELGVYGCVEG